MEKLTTEQLDTLIYLLLNEPEIDVFELDSFCGVFDNVDVRLLDSELHTIIQDEVLVYYLTKSNLTEEEAYLLKMCFENHNSELDVIMDLEYAEEKATAHILYKFISGLNVYVKKNLMDAIASAIQEKYLENK